MKPIRIGIISDTHLLAPTDDFKKLVDLCFHDTQMLIHAGDLIDPAILAAFAGKEVHAVHGNMCTAAACRFLPTRKEIKVGGFVIGLIHRLGPGRDFEDRLIEVFPEADCIVYGHTHIPVCHRTGGILYINPGSFTGSRMNFGSYAILEVGETLKAQMFQLKVHL